MTPLPELVVVTGLDHAAVERVTRAMCRFDDTAGVAHNLRAAGYGAVHRWLRRGGVERVESMQVAPDRVAALVRDDLRAVVGELAADARVRRIVVPLDPALEPGPVCRELLGPAGAATGLARRVDIRGVLTVVEEPTWLQDATGSATLAERGFAAGPGDARTVAQVAVGQVECADAIVLSGIGDLSVAVRNGDVLDRLAPGVRRRRACLDEDAAWMLDDRPAGAARAVAAVDVHGPLLRGRPPLHRDGGVAWLLLSSPLPMHPGRLHDAVPDLLAGSVRSRGRIWLAGRPDEVLWLESAGGGLRVEHAGHWLAASGGWAGADPHRRAFASLRWHPRFGDRAQDLAVLVHRGRGPAIADRLRGALVTAPELAQGPALWASWADPFDAEHAVPRAELHEHAAGTSAPHGVFGTG